MIYEICRSPNIPALTVSRGLNNNLRVKIKIRMRIIQPVNNKILQFLDYWNSLSGLIYKNRFQQQVLYHITILIIT
jgi:hypothetical protein